MKHTFITMAMIIVITTSVFCQTKDEQGVRQTLNEIAAAINSQDMAKLDGFYADDYVLVNPSGARVNKTERLASVKNEKPNGVFGYENVKVRFYGNTAIVNTNVRTSAEQDASTNQTTLVLVRKGKGWQIASAHGTTVSANQSGGNEEQAIRQTITELMDALNRNDGDTAGRIYADDYQIVLQDGTTTSKAERLNAMKSGALKYQSLVFDKLRIRQYGGTAIANYHVTGKSITSKGEQNTNSLATVALVKNGGRWQVVSSQLTDTSAK